MFECKGILFDIIAFHLIFKKSKLKLNNRLCFNNICKINLSTLILFLLYYIMGDCQVYNHSNKIMMKRLNMPRQLCRFVFTLITVCLFPLGSDLIWIITYKIRFLERKLIKKLCKNNQPIPEMDID